MYSVKAKEDWSTKATQYLSEARKFLENSLPKELLRYVNFDAIKLYFWDDPNREGSVYYKPDTNQIILPKEIDAKNISNNEVDKIRSLFVHELMHAVFQGYLNVKNKEKQDERYARYISSNFDISLVSEGTSYLAQLWYLACFSPSKEEPIRTIKNGIEQDFKAPESSKSSDLSRDVSEILDDVRDVLREAGRALREAGRALGINTSYPSPKEQLEAAKVLLNIYEQRDFKNLGEFFFWVYENLDAVIKSIKNESFKAVSR